VVGSLKDRSYRADVLFHRDAEPIRAGCPCASVPTVFDWYPWIVLAHVIGAFGFILAHGVSAFAAFRMRADPRPETVATMLATSSMSFGLMYPSLLVLLVAGIAAGFIGDWWGSAWIWVSIGLLLAIATAMYLIGTTYYIRIRHAVDMPVPQDKKDAPPPVALPPDELAGLLASRRPELLAIIGGGGLVLLVALMVLKPG